MTRVIKIRHRPDGITEVTATAGPADTVTISVPTATWHTLDPETIDLMVKQAISEQRGPVKGR